jgi:TRAP-type C4-dicarboxylate transport system permease small subunit
VSFFKRLLGYAIVALLLFMVLVLVAAVFVINLQTPQIDGQQEHKSSIVA